MIPRNACPRCVGTGCVRRSALGSTLGYIEVSCDWCDGRGYLAPEMPDVRRDLFRPAVGMTYPKPRRGRGTP